MILVAIASLLLLAFNQCWDERLTRIQVGSLLVQIIRFQGFTVPLEVSTSRETTDTLQNRLSAGFTHITHCTAEKEIVGTGQKIQTQ